MHRIHIVVATALTVYGIETSYEAPNNGYLHMLQQHLPFTVLKLIVFIVFPPL